MVTCDDRMPRLACYHVIHGHGRQLSWARAFICSLLAIARLTSLQLRTWCNLRCLAGAAYMLDMQCMLAQLLGVHSQHMCVELLMCACRFSNLKASC